jgi:hypothetical protein
MIWQIRIGNRQQMNIFFDLVAHVSIHRLLNLINVSTIDILKIRLILIKRVTVNVIESSFRLFKF